MSDRSWYSTTVGLVCLTALTFVGFLLVETGHAGASGTETWSEALSSGPPPGRFDAAVADGSYFDKDIVMFGGLSAGNTPLKDTWTWNGSTWTQPSPTGTQPPARYAASMAYDAATSNDVMFGGFTGTTALGDTWIWNGRTGGGWTQYTGPGPSPRYGAAMAYDQTTREVVLFGGFSGSAYLDDTWAWNGSTWTQLKPNPPTAPRARDDASMAWSPVSAALILFGGHGKTTTFGDTWKWNGSIWAKLTPKGADPSPRYLASMDEDRAVGPYGQIVLFGGDSAGGAALDDTWVWGNDAWTRLSLAPSPPAREGAVMGYDPNTYQMVLFGGLEPPLDDTWILTTSATTTTTSSSSSS